MAINVGSAGSRTASYRVVLMTDEDPPTTIQTWHARHLNASALGGLLRSLDLAIGGAAIRRALGRKARRRRRAK